jgi:hypothetical protein
LAKYPSFLTGIEDFAGIFQYTQVFFTSLIWMPSILTFSHRLYDININQVPVMNDPGKGKNQSAGLVTLFMHYLQALQE